MIFAEIFHTIVFFFKYEDGKSEKNIKLSQSLLGSRGSRIKYVEEDKRRLVESFDTHLLNYELSPIADKMNTWLSNWKRYIFYYPRKDDLIHSIRYEVAIPQNSQLNFSLIKSSQFGLPNYGSEVEFKVVVRDSNEGEKIVFYANQNPAEGKSQDQDISDYTVSLEPWWNKDVTIEFTISSGKRATKPNVFLGWGDPQIRIKND